MVLKSRKKSITAKDFEDFEQEQEIKLPISYKKLLVQYNGGFPLNKSFFHGWEIMFLAMKYGRNTVNHSFKQLKDVLPEGFFPFADTYGQLVCMSLNEADYGSVYLFTEEGDIELWSDSFDDFLKEFSEDEEGD